MKVLCVKCHKKLDKLSSHGKEIGKKRKKEPRAQPSTGFTGIDVFKGAADVYKRATYTVEDMYKRAEDVAENVSEIVFGKKRKIP